MSEAKLDMAEETAGGQPIKDVGESSGDKVSHLSAPAAPDPNARLTKKKEALIVGMICALAGLVFGYDIGGSGGTYVMTYFQDHLGWERDANDEWLKWVSDEQGWISSVFPIGALVGALPSGVLADYFGRRRVLMFADVVFVIGAILQFASVNIGMLYAGRIVSGVGIGFLSCLTGVYTGEVAPFQIRGLLVTLFQLAITLGIFLAGLLNLGFREFSAGWRFSYGFNMVFAIAMICGMFFLPESPRWYFMKGNESKCREILSKYRNNEDEVEYEVYLIRKGMEESDGFGTWPETFQMKNKQLYRTILGMSIQLFQQWTGINAVMMFMPTIIESFSDADAALYGNLAIQFSNFAATFIAVYLVDRAGRIKLLLAGGIGMVVSLFTMSMLSAPFSDHEENSGIGAGIIVGGCFYVIFFAFSWGPLGWVICSEIHPNRVRGKAVSLSTATNWLSAFAVGRVTPTMIRTDALDLWGTFLLFMSMCVIMSVWVYFTLPETCGMKLEEMDALFNDFTPGRLQRSNWVPPSKRHLEDEID